MHERGEPESDRRRLELAAQLVDLTHWAHERGLAPDHTFGCLLQIRPDLEIAFDGAEYQGSNGIHTDLKITRRGNGRQLTDMQFALDRIRQSDRYTLQPVRFTSGGVIYHERLASPRRIGLQYGRALLTVRAILAAGEDSITGLWLDKSL